MKEMNFMKIISHDFFNQNAYFDILINVLKSIFLPIVLIIKWVLKTIYIMLIPIVNSKDKNRYNYSTQKYNERLRKRASIEDNFFRVYK